MPCMPVQSANRAVRQSALHAKARRCIGLKRVSEGIRTPDPEDHNLVL